MFPGASSQICRPHFHTPLHPWVSPPEQKSVPHAHSSWIHAPFSGGNSPNSGSGNPKSNGTNHVASSLPSNLTSSSHLFNFPPTPPKDTTPDMSSGIPSSSANMPTSNSVTGASGNTPSDHGLGGASANNTSPGSTGHVVSAGHNNNHDGSHAAAPHNGSSHDNNHNTSEFSPDSKPGSKHADSINSAYSDPLSSGFGSSHMSGYPTYGHDYAGSSLFHSANMFKASFARVRTQKRSSSGESK